MKPVISAFKNSPDRGRGLARDMRLRWALEEVGQPYEVEYFTFTELKDTAYRGSQPFGQVPFYKEGDLTLFESGAIVLHIAEKHRGLLPTDSKARARALSWMLCALNTVEPPIFERSLFNIVERDKPWFQERLPLLDERAHTRLTELANQLGDSQWLDGEFSAGDLLKVTVLMRAAVGGLLEAHKTLADYVARAQSRPAFQRAFAAQLAAYNASLNKE
jgi:glutathione S-transferase